jgi:hypothetical protein
MVQGRMGQGRQGFVFFRSFQPFPPGNFGEIGANLGYPGEYEFPLPDLHNEFRNGEVKD